jgi:hypothetical protein
MGDFWKHILGPGNKDLDIAKSGDNYFSVLKQKDEIILAVIQPPSSYDGKTSVGGKLAVYNANGEIDVARSKEVDYGTPIILFNPNNKANLKIVDAMSEAKRVIPNAQKEVPDYKIDVKNLKEENVVEVNDNNRVILGSTALDFKLQDKEVSIIHSPRLSSNDQDFLRLFLQFMTESIMGAEIKKHTYRANIMLLDPKENRFKVAAYYNMDRYADRNISLTQSQGIAGEAIRMNRIRTVDLTNASDNLNYGIDPRNVWEEMKSIFAIPIWDSNDVKVGVMNMDSDQLLHESKFRDHDFEGVMRLASRSIGIFLETKI